MLQSVKIEYLNRGRSNGDPITETVEVNVEVALRIIIDTGAGLVHISQADNGEVRLLAPEGWLALYPEGANCARVGVMKLVNPRED